MELDVTRTDRDYLYGRLLALADAVAGHQLAHALGNREGIRGDCFSGHATGTDRDVQNDALRQSRRTVLRTSRGEPTGHARKR